MEMWFLMKYFYFIGIQKLAQQKKTTLTQDGDEYFKKKFFF